LGGWPLRGWKEGRLPLNGGGLVGPMGNQGPWQAYSGKTH